MRRPLVSLILMAFFVISLVFAGYLVYEYKITSNEMPVIICPDEEFSASISVTDEQLLADVKATDKEDGDITASVNIESVSKFVEKGVSYVTYVVSDSAKNVVKKTRRIKFIDYVSPQFSLTRPLAFLYGSKTFELKDYIKANDGFDGDISHNIKITTVGDVPSLYDIGVWTIKATVTNSMGDTSSILLDVTVDEQTYTEKRFSPQILLKDYLIYITKDEQIEPKDYLDGIIIDTDKINITDSIKDQIRVTGEIDYSTPGVYKINYIYTSEANYTSSVDLIVTVIE